MKKKYLLLFCLSFLCSHKIWADVGSIQIRLNENMQVVDLATSSVSTPTIDEVFVQQGGLTTAEENQCTFNEDGVVQTEGCICPEGYDKKCDETETNCFCCQAGNACRKVDNDNRCSSDAMVMLIPLCGCPDGEYPRKEDGSTSSNEDNLPFCCDRDGSYISVKKNDGTRAKLSIEDKSEDFTCGACPTASIILNDNFCCNAAGKIYQGDRWSDDISAKCYCAMEDKTNCTSQDTCTNTPGMEWCETGVCMPKDTCPCVPGSTTSPCTEETACTNQNGCWINEICEAQDPEKICAQRQCEAQGNNWCITGGEGKCQEQQCPCVPGSETSACTEETACTTQNGCWYNGTCNAKGTCSADQSWDGNICACVKPCDEGTQRTAEGDCIPCPKEGTLKGDAGDYVCCDGDKKWYTEGAWSESPNYAKCGCPEGQYLKDDQCVACTEDFHCPDDKVCNTDNTCVQCTEEKDNCEGNQICKNDYTCGCADENAHGLDCLTCAEEDLATPVLRGEDCVTCAAANENTPVWKVIEEKGQCVSCAVADQNKPVWNSTSEQCEDCPSGQRWDGSECVPPPANSEWSGDQYLCNAGYTLNGTTCQACDTGTYKDWLGNDPCTACAVGKYQDEIGQTSCKDCDANKTTTDKGATASTQCVCNAGYTLNGTTCQACAKGKYKSSAGNTACDACPKGYYQDKTGQTQCIACSGGRTTANTGATASTECVCPSGQNWNGTTCGACPANTPYWNGSKCVTCAAVDSKKPFWDVENGVCVAGCNTTMVQGTDNTCQCDKSTDSEDPSKNSKTPVWDAWRNRCVSCFRYNEKTPVWNGTTCEACPEATPVWDLYNEKCVPCYDSISANWTDLGCGGTVDHSSYNPRQNKWSSGEVIEPRVCKVDADNTNNNICVQCTEHSHCPGATPKCENNSCSACPANSEWIDDQCQCKAGYTLKDGTCTPCAKGTYKTSAGNEEDCTACGGGRITTGTGATASTDCVCPSDEPKWNDTQCEACPDNAPKWNGTECEACPDNAPKWNGTECEDCPTNTPKWDTTKQKCVQCTEHTHCREGKYCNSDGSCANCDNYTKCGCTYFALKGECVGDDMISVPTDICPPDNLDNIFWPAWCKQNGYSDSKHYCYNENSKTGEKDCRPHVVRTSAKDRQ